MILKLKDNTEINILSYHKSENPKDKQYYAYIRIDPQKYTSQEIQKQFTSENLSQLLITSDKGSISDSYSAISSIDTRLDDDTFSLNITLIKENV